MIVSRKIITEIGRQLTPISPAPIDNFQMARAVMWKLMPARQKEMLQVLTALDEADNLPHEERRALMQFRMSPELQAALDVATVEVKNELAQSL